MDDGQRADHQAQPAGGTAHARPAGARGRAASAAQRRAACRLITDRLHLSAVPRSRPTTASVHPEWRRSSRWRYQRACASTCCWSSAGSSSTSTPTTYTRSCVTPATTAERSRSSSVGSRPLDVKTAASSGASTASSWVPRSASWSKWSLGRSCSLVLSAEMQSPEKKRFDPGPPPPGLGMPEGPRGPRFLYGKPQSWDRPAPGTTKHHGLRGLLTRARSTRRRVERAHR